MASTQVKVGQVWGCVLPQVPHFYKVSKIGYDAGNRVAFAYEVDRITKQPIHSMPVVLGSVSNQDLTFVGVGLGSSDWYIEHDVSDSIVPTLRSPQPETRIERPCRNKWCGRMNDLGVKICWLCETENPTARE